MALVTKRVREKAQRCLECVEKRQKVRDFLIFKRKMAGKGVFDKETAQAIYTGAKFVIDNLARLSCNFFIHKEDFEKVFGMTPAEYLTREILDDKVKQ